MMNGIYKGKNFSVLGDSISTLYGYCPNGYEVFYNADKCFEADVFSMGDTWWGKVIDGLGGKLLVNNSWSGSMVSKHRLCVIPSFGASDERTSSLGKDGICPDVIMVYLGTNDWGASVKIKPEKGEENDVSVFLSAYRIMLEKIYSNYKNAEIWCFTIGCGKKSGKPTFEFLQSADKDRLVEYCEAIKACAKELDCRLIDLYAETEIEPFDTIDGYHPNANGMSTIASAVIRTAEKFEKKSK